MLSSIERYQVMTQKAWSLKHETKFFMPQSKTLRYMQWPTWVKHGFNFYAYPSRVAEVAGPMLAQPYPLCETIVERVALTKNISFGTRWYYVGATPWCIQIVPNLLLLRSQCSIPVVAAYSLVTFEAFFRRLPEFVGRCPLHDWEARKCRGIHEVKELGCKTIDADHKEHVKCLRNWLLLLLRISRQGVFWLYTEH